ncbi:MAG: hypothetical protein QM538_01420 [Methylacidiphilales bacterium]|nr:hypothetical protein [Candidatus Methylacidiphilales bacterium]
MFFTDPLSCIVASQSLLHGDRVEFVTSSENFNQSYVIDPLKVPQLLESMTDELTILFVAYAEVSLADEKLKTRIKDSLSRFRKGEISFGLQSLIQVSFIRLECVTLSSIQKLIRSCFDHNESPLSSLTLSRCLSCQDRFLSKELAHQVIEQKINQRLSALGKEDSDSNIWIYDFPEGTFHSLYMFAKQMSVRFAKCIVAKNQKAYAYYSVYELKNYDEISSNSVWFASTSLGGFGLAKHTTRFSAMFSNSKLVSPVLVSELTPRYLTVSEFEITESRLYEIALAEPYGLGNQDPIIVFSCTIFDYYPDGKVITIVFLTSNGETLKGFIYNSDHSKQLLRHSVGEKVTVRARIVFSTASSTPQLALVSIE